MYYDVKFVTPLDSYIIHVEFENGKQGNFDLTPYLDHGVFRMLNNVEYFKQVGIVFGAVTWPDGQDIAPETLYESIHAEMIAS